MLNNLPLGRQEKALQAEQAREERDRNGDPDPDEWGEAGRRTRQEEESRQSRSSEKRPRSRSPRRRYVGKVLLVKGLLILLCYCLSVLGT